MIRMQGDRGEASQETGSWTRHPALKDLFDPPRRTRRAQIAAALFGLLLVTSLTVPAVTDEKVAPGMTVAMSGLTAIFFADLLDPELHHFVVCLRFVGLAIGVFGLVLQFI